MLEKIKKLLDSGCWVEVMYKPVEDWAEFMDKIIAYSSEDVFDRLINWRGDLFFPDLDCITSIKPIARPLYNYKVGDKVVVLDNYEGKYLIFWEIVEITNIWNGTIEVEKNKDIYSIDTRCIAPVLD